MDSFNSGTGKFTCISGASAPKQVVQAQRAARCKPRRIHDSQHKKRHRDFSKEVDSLGVGQFSNIQQNAALCSAMLSKVHNGAVAIRNGANRGLRTRYLIHSLSHKKRKHRNFDAFFFGGKRWIRTTEGGANRFTVCSLWPLGNLPIWSWWSESNQQPADYKSAALPLSHTSRVSGRKLRQSRHHNKNGALGRN